MKTNQQSSPCKTPRVLLITLTTIVLFSCSLQVSAQQWNTNGNDIHNTNSGNVGIGTTTPNAALEINKSQNSGISIVIDNPFTSAGNAAHSGFLLKQAGAFRLLVSSVNDNHGSLAPGTAQFWNFANGPTVFANNNTEVMRLTAGGNLGIGTTNPGARLVTFGNFLAGNITSPTNLYPNYSLQSPVILELGYGTPTANATPQASLVLSKNLTNPNNLIGVISFANSNIADGNDKRLSGIAGFTEGALNSGTLQFYTSATGSFTERMRINPNGNVGIGTSTPSSRFEVVAPGTWIARFRRTDNSNGGIVIESPAGFNPNLALGVNGVNKWHLLSNSSNSDALQFWESSGTQPRFTLTQSGTVGLGTATPNAAYKLDVNGNVNASGLCIAGNCKTAWPVFVSSQWTTNGTAINYTGGNVGIGVASPTTQLEVAGTVDADAFTINGATVVSSQWTSISGAINYGGTVGIGTATPNAAHKLDVNGSANASALCIAGDCKSTWPTGAGSQWTSNGTAINYTGGNVGIGATTPQDALHLFSTALSVGTIRVQGGATKAGFIGFWEGGPSLLLTNNRHPGTGNNFNTALAGAQFMVGPPSAPGDIAFYTTSSGPVGTATELVRMKADGKFGIGTAAPAFRLDVQGGAINSSGGLCLNGDCKTAWSQVGGTSQWTTIGTTINYSAGNVGIGIATPVEKLDVGGNVKVTGNVTASGTINAKYQDVAEWVDSSQELQAGTVVVLDSSRSNQVIASTQSYDSRVAGVISLQPGLALGEEAAGRVLVATTGRVKVKVDASDGPIQIGDLLVTSRREGFAMKSLPVDIGGTRIHRPGTLIGKALEPLAKGTGEILVLLSLQ